MARTTTIGAAQQQPTITAWNGIIDYDNGIETGLVNTVAEHLGGVTFSGHANGPPNGTTKYAILESNVYTPKWDTGKPRIRIASNGTHVFTCSTDFMHFRKLAIRQGSTGSSDEVFRITTGMNDIVYEKVFFELENNTSQQDGIYAGNYAVTDINLFDCVGVSGGSNTRCTVHGQNFSGSGAQTWTLEHCTFITPGYIDGINQLPASVGIQQDTSDGGSTAMEVNNTLYSNSNVETTAAEDPGTFTGDYNISENSTGTQFGVNSVVDVDYKTVDAAGNQMLVTNLTDGSYDFQLLDGATGTDLAVDAVPSDHASRRDTRIDIDFDIAGNARPSYASGNRDLGAFEIAAAPAGGLSIPVAMHHYTKNIGSRS